MKIAILSPAHPLRGGIAASSERLATELQAQGHEVVMWSFSVQYPSVLFPGKTQYTDSPPPADLDIRTSVNSINPLNWWRVGRQMRGEAYDAVICRFWLPFMAMSTGSILRQLDRKRTHIVALVDNFIPHEKRPGDVQLSRYFVGACDAFVAMSHAVADDLRAAVGDKPVRFTPHPVYDIYGPPVEQSQAQAHLKLPGGKRYALFFGFIRHYKGLDLLLEAATSLPADYHVIVAGEFYDKKESYQPLLNQLGDRVHLYDDYIPDDEIRYYFGAADVVVQPYRTATQSGISQVAYHFGTPMIVTRVGGLPEIVPDGEAGYVVDVDPRAIADALLRYYERGGRMAFEAGVAAHRERFSWGRLAEVLLEGA